jgi:hypothetical protein
MNDKICKIINSNKNKIDNLSKKIKKTKMNCCNNEKINNSETGLNLPPGTCFSDYLYWNTGTNEWEGGSNEVRIGCDAGKFNQIREAIAIGKCAGQTGQNSSIGIGVFAGEINQVASIAIGFGAGRSNQMQDSVAIGFSAGTFFQNTSAIAIGRAAGNNSQGTGSIAIGHNAGFQNQGENSIAIGFGAGGQTAHANTIILNASGNNVNSEDTNGFYVNPIKETGSTGGLYPLYYNTGTHEILYFIPQF